MNIEIKNNSNLTQATFDATGTKWFVEFLAENPQNIIPKIQTLVTDFEAKYSRFKDTSLTNELKREGVLENPPADLIKMIRFGTELSRLTQNKFNIAMGSKLEAQGYDKNYSFELKDENKNINPAWLKTINENIIEIEKDVMVDFGAYGKGYLIDLITELLIENSADQITVNGGGDIRFFDSSNISKKFYLENPFDISEFIGTIEVANEGIASSSNNRRTWTDKRTGKKFSHIQRFDGLEMDNDIVGVFTKAKTAMIADGASTAIYLSSMEDFERIASTLEVEYLVVFENGSFIKSSNYNPDLNI